MLREQIDNTLNNLILNSLKYYGKSYFTLEKFGEELEGELLRKTGHRMRLCVEMIKDTGDNSMDQLIVIKKETEKGSLYIYARDAYTNQLLIRYLQETRKAA